MRSKVTRIFIGVAAVVALGFLLNSCGAERYCPTCGTTVNGAYTVLDVIPVPEHNPTGEPGGPFNSFDISWWDPNLRRAYSSDRIGLDIVVTDTVANAAIGTIGGLNEVANAGNNGSPCLGVNTVPAGAPAGFVGIPSIITGTGAIRNATSPGTTNVLTRFGCRNPGFFDSFSTFFPGFGAHGAFGGFPGAQCCASRANGVNPISGPDGNLVTPDGKTLFVGSGSSSVVAFDLTVPGLDFNAVVPIVIAAFPTGSSPDFDGPAGVTACIASWNGGAGSDPTCADDRSDEMSFGTVNGHDILTVSNGDPGLPLVTLIDVTDITHRTYTPGSFVTPAGLGYCAPVNPNANYNPGVVNFGTGLVAGENYPTCILGQIYYDAASPQDSTVAVDNANGIFCPDPSENVASGVTGTGVGPGGTDVPCHHAPIVDVNTGFFITNNGAAGNNQQGEFGVAGLGASAFNPLHNTFYVENLNCTASNSGTQASTAVGCIDEIDPRIGNPAGPIVINVVPSINCMPAGIVQGPGHDFLIGCGGHDGTQFPPLLIIFDGTCTTSAACFASEVQITQSGGTDEVWYNPGDNRYYTAGRDMPNGPVMGVVDAGTRTWLVNVPTGSNSHSITVDAVNNHAIVPLQAGARCTTQSANGCIGVYGRQ
jgi:hypothetical protein